MSSNLQSLSRRWNILIIIFNKKNENKKRLYLFKRENY